MAKPPVVLFMAPDKFTKAYAAMMNKLTVEALASIGKEPGDVELIGFVSTNANEGGSCLHFLNRSGIDPYNVVALVLFGEAGDQFGFDSSSTDDYVLGNVILPASSVSYLTLCIPSLSTGWLTDRLHWDRIRTVYAGLLKNGRKALQGTENYMFLTPLKAKWN